MIIDLLNYNSAGESSDSFPWFLWQGNYTVARYASVPSVEEVERVRAEYHAQIAPYLTRRESEPKA